MKRKGQFVSMIAVVALLFISGGSLFTAMFTQSTFGEHVSYYTQDIGSLLEARIEGTFYNYTVKKEMNFTENNVAWKMRGSDDDPYYEWSASSSIPDYSNIKSSYRDKYMTGEEVGLTPQIFVNGCTGPSLSLNTLDKDEIVIQMSDKSIRCGSRKSYAEVFFARENPNDKTLKVENSKNRYLRVAELATRLGDFIDSHSAIPSDLETTGEATEDEEPSEDQDNDFRALNGARSNAYDNFTNKKGSLASTIKSDFSKNGKDWVNIDVETVVPTQPSYYTVLHDEIHWDTHHAYCSNEQKIDECDTNGNETLDASETPCDCWDYGKEDTYHTKVRFEPPEMYIYFNVTDSENQIRTWKGEKTTQFNIKYTVDLN